MRRWLRNLLIGAGVLCLLLAALALAIAWAARSETALAWFTARLGEATEGRLTVGKAEGSVIGPLKLTALRYRDGETSVTVDVLELDWSPVRLLNRHVHLKRVAIGELRIDAGGDDGPAPPPASLRLPVAVTATEIAVGALIAGDLALRDIALALESRADSHRIARLRLRHDLGSLQGQVSLGADAPFPVTGKLQAAPAEPGPVPALDAELSGTLAKIGVEVLAQAPGLRLRARTNVMPFEAQPVAGLEADLESLDPSRLGTGLPHAALAGRLVASLGIDQRLSGSVALRNDAPATIDAGGLPVHALAAALGGSLAAPEFRSLRIDLPGNGSLEGRARFADAALILQVRASAIDLKALHGSLRRSALEGTIALAAGENAQIFDADLRQDGMRARFSGSLRGDTLTLREALLDANGGQLLASGAIALGGKQEFSTEARLRGFDPSRFGDFPKAEINARLEASGHLSPQWRVALDYRIADSRLHGQPLAGDGRLVLAPQLLQESRGELALGANRLRFSGGFGAPDLSLDWSLDAPRIAQLARGWSGAARGEGRLSGTQERPAARFDIEVSALALAERLAVRSLSMHGHLGEGAGAPLELNARAAGVDYGGIALESAELQSSGTRERHALTLRARHKSGEAHLAATGGLLDGPRWDGVLEQLEWRGHPQVRLEAPARVTLGPGAGQAGTARLNVAGATLTLERAQYGDGRFSTRGRFDALSVIDLLPEERRQALAGSDLVIAGEWDVAAAETVNGWLSLRRERGDLVLAAEENIPLRLAAAMASVHIVDSRIRGSLEATGERLGHVTGSLETMLSRREGTWGLQGNAPLQASLRAEMPSLAWVGPMVKPGLALTGSLTARMEASGTVAGPVLAGEASGTGFSARDTQVGLDLREGELRAEFRNDVLDLKSFSVRAGKGTLTASGWLRPGLTPTAELNVRMERMTVLARPERYVVVTGDGRISAEGRKLRVTGKVRADEARVAMPKAGTPRLSDDVVIVGRRERKDQQPAIRAHLDLELDLGDEFRLSGRGLDTRLEGNFRVTSDGTTLPRALGAVKAAEGTYTAYGTRLAIERGVVTFSGPIDNPGLDILAMRKNQEVEAGVHVTGTAQKPRIALVSDPPVPDGEKLAWLTLGRGAGDSEGKDYALLGAAASALLEESEALGIKRQMAGELGIQEIGVSGSGALSERVVTVGARIASNAYVTIEQSLAGAGSVVKLNYTISRRLSMQTQAGTDNAVDLLYTFSFD